MTIHDKHTNSEELASRKQDHIALTLESQTLPSSKDGRFDYEPLFFIHPEPQDKWESVFLGKELDYPLWISSMTGGSQNSRAINENLARLCGEFRLGMGLGSCRNLLTSKDRLEDFAVRKYLGNQPLYANLGIAQLEELVLNNKIHLINEIVRSTEADGLIIHINPLQEWIQPEGDRYRIPPLVSLTRFLEASRFPVIVKEVGQGMGPKSLKALLELPIAAIELGAYGGTNFSQVENLRGATSKEKLPFIHVGHTALEMVNILNAYPARGKQFIISGGIKNVLDGYELKMRLNAPSVIGMAQAFLTPAQESYEALQSYFLDMKEALLTAKRLLKIKDAQ